MSTDDKYWKLALKAGFQIVIACVSNKNIFIDLTDRVDFSGEKGLQGLAFHPDFSTNGYFYVYYNTDPLGDSVIARYTINDFNANLGNKSSELIILTVVQPFPNHNGGQIAFGLDKYLYIALGDGGSGGDPLEHGQNRSTLLGSILRIDVDNPANGNYYGIPIDNPFVGNVNNYREEIYAYGLRNPWRLSFDPVTERFWAGDVGQNSREEINIIENGKNYGWNIVEGFICYEPSVGCNTTGLEAPIIDYNRSEGTTVTGGYVYRGPTLPSLVGKYIYADFGNGNIWSLEYDGIHQTNNSLIVDANFAISSFGTDAANELYILNYYDGDIYKFTAEIIPKSSSQQTQTSSTFQTQTLSTSQSQESSSASINTITTADSEIPPKSASFSGVSGFEIILVVFSFISMLVFCRRFDRV